MDRRRNRLHQPAYHMRRTRWPRAWRITVLAASGIAGLFVLANGALWAAYHGRTYPRTKVVDTTIGSVPYDQIAKIVDSKDILPEQLTFRHEKTTATVRLSELGLRLDSERTAAHARQQRSWLPIVNLFKTTRLKAPIVVEDMTFDQQATKLAATFQAAPTNARLALSGSTVNIAAEKAGYTLRQDQLQQAVTAALDRGNATVAVPVNIVPAQVAAGELQDDQQLLRQQLDTSVVYRYNGQVKKPTKEELATWFVPSSNVYTLSPDAVVSYLAAAGKTWGIRVKDTAQVATATIQAVSSKKPVDITLVAVTAVRTYKYCTATRGVDSSELASLRAKLQSTYADSRGWSTNGLIEYTYVTTGCDFTVWLAAAAQMPSFGAICDSMWSCRVGPNVVLNYDRWRYASPAWNQYGGTLEEYRSMVINHETGHWLGFGHSMCPGAGQQAPVMQQQSINLQGCSFNPWPTAGEIATLRQRLGI